jgi:MFS transporter, OFA family, oxalate/formate antiporter
MLKIKIDGGTKVISNKKGWIVVFAGTGINLAFGVLYAWSIFAKNLIETQNWTTTEASLPYTFAIAFLALVMMPAGRLQDKIGSRKVATLGSILTGSGLILAGYLTSVTGLVFSFGILVGSGIGFGYAAVTPAAIKWFPPEKKGLITGIVIAGFGLSTLYSAPLANYLINTFGVFNAFRILGFAFLLIVSTLAQFIKEPKQSVKSTISSKKGVVDLDWTEVIKTRQFYQLWFIFFAGAFGGLMIIGHLSKIASIQLGNNLGFILVALSAIANALGRPISGAISDKLGRGKTIMVLYSLQGTVLIFFKYFTSFWALLFGVIVIYFSYGAMASIIPSACGDYYGTKNLGVNYGIIFSAFLLSGIGGPLVAGFIADRTGSYNLAFLISAGIIFVAAFIGFIMKPYVHKSPENTIPILDLELAKQ